MLGVRQKHGVAARDQHPLTSLVVLPRASTNLFTILRFLPAGCRSHVTGELQVELAILLLDTMESSNEWRKVDLRHFRGGALDLRKERLLRQFEPLQPLPAMRLRYAERRPASIVREASSDEARTWLPTLIVRLLALRGRARPYGQR